MLYQCPPFGFKGKHAYYHMSLVMRKSAFCICENKDADQLRVASRNREADQRLWSRYTDTIHPLYFLNPEFQASSHLVWSYSLVCVGLGRKPRISVFSQRGSYRHAGVKGFAFLKRKICLGIYEFNNVVADISTF